MQVKRSSAFAFAVVVAGLAVGCGSSSDSSTSTAPATTGGGASTAAPSAASDGASDGVKTAQAAVDQAMQPVTEYELPTEQVETAALKGKTLYYIPLLTQVPAFAITGANITQAGQALGMKVQTCNGGANPSQVSGCVDQAVGAGAAGIIMDSIPYGMAQNSLDKAVAKQIPVIITDQIPEPGAKSTSSVGYLPGAIDQEKVMADWVIAHSGGKANVIVTQETDSPSTIAYIEQYALPEYEKLCPDCTVTLNKVTASNYARTGPTTSAALIKNPDADYLHLEFADVVQPSMDAIQQANRQAKMNVVVGSGTVAALQQVKSGGPLKAVLTTDTAYQGWADVDLILRMITGASTLPEYTTPTRLITSDNIGDITVSDAAAASGEWYGPATYQDDFKALWGVG